MTSVDDRRDPTKPLPPAETRAAGRFDAGRGADGALEGLRRVHPPPGPAARPRALQAQADRRPAPSSASSLNVLRSPGPRPRHRHHRQRRSTTAASISPSCTPSSWRRSALYAGSAVFSLLQRLHPGRRRAAAHVPTAAGGRGQDQRAAAQLYRPRVPGRPAEPGHQRHRQHRPEPAADPQPDAHSVLLLIGVAVMMFTISPLLAVVALTTVPVSVFVMRKIAARASPASSPSGAAPGRSTPSSRRPSPVTPS